MRNVSIALANIVNLPDKPPKYIGSFFLDFIIVYILVPVVSWTLYAGMINYAFDSVANPP